MRGIIILVLSVAFINLVSCKTEETTKGDLIEINIPEALKNVKDFKLSDLVKNVELLELQTGTDFYIQQGVTPHFGEKYILVFDYDTKRVYLFNRDGSFVSEIGKVGKGPGEHEWDVACDMNPSETHIVMVDMRVSKVMIFNVDGTLEVEKNISEHFANPFVLKVSWDLEDAISFLPRRPYEPTDDFSSVELFDKQLNYVGKVLPRLNNDSLQLHAISHHEVFGKDKKAYFWESFSDTIYSFNSKGESEALYHINVGDNKLPADILSSHEYPNIYKYDMPMMVSWLGDYLYIPMLIGGEDRPSRIDVFYDTKKNEAFSIDHKVRCNKSAPSATNKSRNLENDIFALEEVGIWQYSYQQNLCIHPINVDLLTHFSDIDCIKNLDVKNPDLLKRIVQIIEDPQEEDGNFVVLMHLR